MSHTPGPWNVCEPTRWPKDYNLPAERLEGTYSVGTRPGMCLAFVSGATDAETVANAHLIAAAPEMLALLENLHTDLCRYAKLTEEVWSSGSIAFDSMATDICRAITKAKGGAK